MATSECVLAQTTSSARQAAMRMRPGGSARQKSSVVSPRIASRLTSSGRSWMSRYQESAIHAAPAQAASAVLPAARRKSRKVQTRIAATSPAWRARRPWNPTACSTP